jgi:small-conductance mechanosensitive channel
VRLWNAIAQANGGVDFAIALTLLLVVPFAIALARRVALRLLAPGIVAALAAATSAWLLLPLATYAAILALEVPPRVDRVAAAVALVAVVVQAGLWAHRALSHWLSLRFERTRAQDPQAATTVKLIGYAVQGLLWLLVVLLALDQLGFDVTARVAGLGIGGVAIALAVQSVLGDLFACAAIALDKPFVVGDFIVVDGLRGTVESIGLKTTRVRSLDGELRVFSNADLLKSRLRNFKRMQERRVQFGLGVTYGTRVEQLRRIARWLREAVEAQPKTRFDRAHFKGYGDSSLDFEVVYYVLEPDYNVHMDVQQSLNLAIYERFAAEGVEFAFPTRTLFLRRDGVAPKREHPAPQPEHPPPRREPSRRDIREAIAARTQK